MASEAPSRDDEAETMAQLAALLEAHEQSSSSSSNAEGAADDDEVLAASTPPAGGGSRSDQRATTHEVEGGKPQGELRALEGGSDDAGHGIDAAAEAAAGNGGVNAGGSGAAATGGAEAFVGTDQALEAGKREESPVDGEATESQSELAQQQQQQQQQQQRVTEQSAVASESPVDGEATESQSEPAQQQQQQQQQQQCVTEQSAVANDGAEAERASESPEKENDGEELARGRAAPEAGDDRSPDGGDRGARTAGGGAETAVGQDAQAAGDGIDGDNSDLQQHSTREGQGDRAEQGDRIDEEASPASEPSELDDEVAAAKIQSLARQKAAAKAARRKQRAQERVDQWAAATMIQATIRRSFAGLIVQARKSEKEATLRAASKIQSLARGMTVRKEVRGRVETEMEEKVRIRDKLDSELAALNESVEEIIEKQREREDREAAKYKAELDTLRTEDKDLGQVLRARRAALEEVINKSHELQNVAERMIHGKNELVTLQNRDHVLAQDILPLRSDRTSLEATIAAQEQALVAVDIKNQEFATTHEQLTKELADLKQKVHRGTALESHEVSKEEKQLRALHEENQFLAAQLKRCRAGKQPRPSAAFEKHAAKREAKLTKLSRHVGVLKDDIRKAQQSARARFKSLRFDEDALGVRQDKMAKSLEEAEEQLKVEAEKKTRILKQIGGLRRRGGSVNETNTAAQPQQTPETNRHSRDTTGKSGKRAAQGPRRGAGTGGGGAAISTIKARSRPL